MTVLKSTLKSTLNSKAIVFFQCWVDKMIIKTFFHIRSRRKKDLILILAGTGSGNIGDNAMVSSIVENTQSKVAIAGGSAGALADKVNVINFASPALIGKPYPLRLKDVLKFADFLCRSSKLYIIGADVMDGLYSRVESITRINFAAISSSLDVSTHITGFSWPENPDKTVISFLSKTKTPRYNLRDPLSYSRFKQTFPEHDHRLVADVAFASSSRLDLPIKLAHWLAEDDSPVALVNVSGLIGARGDFANEYVRVAKLLKLSGWRICFIPHVIRKSDSDLDAIREVYAIHGDNSAYLQEDLLLPGQIRTLAARSEIVITGRMHLSILSLQQGTPSICLSTQGKVAGLYEMFSISDLVVEPTHGFGNKIVSLIENKNWDVVRKNITNTIPLVIRQAHQQFE